jgi:hypothetical protein
MVLSDCIVTVNELIFANMTVEFMENDRNNYQPIVLCIDKF